MSKINRIRLVNLNYNNNAIRVSDETLNLNGRNTLISLRNGGGKSVMVQMLIAPFAHKRYWNTDRRPFESFFNGARPTFIMVEWALDRGAGYVLTGMMVRRNQNAIEEGAEVLEIVNFVHEYRQSSEMDLSRIPIVESTGKEIKLKSFNVCRQLFATYKSENPTRFNFYDMNNSAQSRQYFEKLREYGIFYKEWENIIKKINMEESGLSNLFANCRDEKGLLEKWFIDAVESKLNRDKNRMKEFQSLTGKYVASFKENESKIKRRDTIRLFTERSAEIQEKGEALRESETAEVDARNRVASFNRRIGELLKAREDAAGIERESEELAKKQIQRVIYERYSAEIHQKDSEIKKSLANLKQLELELDDREKEVCDTKKQVALQELALLSLEKNIARRDALDEEERLDALERDESEKEPERKKIGYTLRTRYEEQERRNADLQGYNTDAFSEMSAKIDGWKAEQDDNENALLRNTAEISALKTRIDGYDQTEDRFNRRWNESLTRNILGEYEPAALEIMEDALEKTGREIAENLKTSRASLESGKEKLHDFNREMEDKRQRLTEQKVIIRHQENALKELEREKSERANILKYVELSESDLFDAPKIHRALERKRELISAAKRKLERREDQTRKELSRLRSGETLELDPEFAEMLDSQGLRYTYGMAWLKKNGFSEEKNKEFAARRPFLPYSLLLSEQELKKLREKAPEIHTSFPVPIMLREDLESAEGKFEGPLSEEAVSGVRFYLSFDEGLLNEESFQALLREKEEALSRLADDIKRRAEEENHFFSCQQKIAGQKLTEKLWQDENDAFAELTRTIQELEEATRREAGESDEMERALEELKGSISQGEKDLETNGRELESLKETRAAYSSYLEDRSSMSEESILEKKLRAKKTNYREWIDAGREKLNSLNDEKRSLSEQRRALEKRIAVYERYEETECLMEDTETLEARFKALTEGISARRKDIEERLEKANKRLQRTSERLDRKAAEERMEPSDWENVIYSAEEESHQKRLLVENEEKLKDKESARNEEDKHIAVLKKELDHSVERMREECDMSEPLPMTEIRVEDFQGEISRLKYGLDEIRLRINAHEKKIRSYQTILTALAEYAEIPVTKPVECQEDFDKMPDGALLSFKGMMIRDLKNSEDSRRDARENLSKAMDQILRNEMFRDDFYREPLESLNRVTERGTSFLEQLDIILRSYDAQMKKLDVDISLVEKEKTQLTELFMDYLREVHNNLGMIDHNSTITVRDRQLKMLRLTLPVWEDKESEYRLKLQEFIDTLTQAGLTLYQQNQNAEEYFGTQLTTKNLYDTIVGFSNIQIQLYKIEEQREYPITWAEVARNSGGEGFLSAFVVLSCLLYYTRRDDTDLFADYNEGKVLIMDNPFAQTNAAHLLKPLMDMAAKANTQLICLTGLSGDAIYSCFNNIYVLNLISASLRSGAQYLKADHIRGSEVSEILPARIEVLEQETLF